MFSSRSSTNFELSPPKVDKTSVVGKKKSLKIRLFLNFVKHISE